VARSLRRSWLNGNLSRLLYRDRVRGTNARHSASIQPLCLWDYSSWINVSYCSRDCERTLRRSGPIFIPLAAVLANLVGSHAAIRAVCCARYSRVIDLSNERRATHLITAPPNTMPGGRKCGFAAPAHVRSWHRADKPDVRCHGSFGEKQTWRGHEQSVVRDSLR
jgi:hypothetical protein